MPKVADASATLPVLACVSLAFFVLSCGPHRGTSAIRGTPPVDDHPRVVQEPCRVDGLGEMVRCGTLYVPEDPAVPEGRRIPLRIVVLPATGPDRAPDPIFALTGGAGQAATERAAAFAEELAMSRSRRDLVLVDQRGTGGSNPLRCRFSDGSGSGGITVEAIRRCRAEFERVADLRRYTTPYAAADLEAVRRALGYARINLDAGSYGTRLALVYIRAYPDRVRSAVLHGVSPTDFRNPLPFPRAGQQALEELFDACAADPSCAEAFPDLAASFDAVLARLDSGAVQVYQLSVSYQSKFLSVSVTFAPSPALGR